MDDVNVLHANRSGQNKSWPQFNDWMKRSHEKFKCSIADNSHFESYDTIWQHFTVIW